MRHLRVNAAVHRVHVSTGVHDQIWHCFHSFHQQQLHPVKADAPALQMLQIARNLHLQKPSHLLSFGHWLSLAIPKSVNTSADSVQVREAQARGKPYTVVFVGVNGVGKSTNLAKIAYWLLQNDVKVRSEP